MQRLLLLLCMAVPALAQSAHNSTLLDGMRDRARPILIFGGTHEPRVVEQYAELAHREKDLQDRQIAVVFVSRTHIPDGPDNPPLGTVAALPAEQATLRRQFHIAPNTFTVILIGKDGGEKFRSTTVVPFQKLAALIDTMPMRQQEMHTR